MFPVEGKGARHLGTQRGSPSRRPDARCLGSAATAQPGSGLVQHPQEGGGGVRASAPNGTCAQSGSGPSRRRVCPLFRKGCDRPAAGADLVQHAQPGGRPMGGTVLGPCELRCRGSGFVWCRGRGATAGSGSGSGPACAGGRRSVGAGGRHGTDPVSLAGAEPGRPTPGKGRDRPPAGADLVQHPTGGGRVQASGRNGTGTHRASPSRKWMCPMPGKGRCAPPIVQPCVRISSSNRRRAARAAS